MASPSPSPPSLSPTPHPAHSSHPSHQATAPQSKRDKRRHALSEKLTTLTTSFHSPSNPRPRDLHYRAQLASLQADMQLITKCDVSGRGMRLLDDAGETIQKEVDETLKAMGVGDLVSTASGKGKEEAAGLAGRWYREFVEEVNDAIEDRDAQLTILWNAHRSKSQSLAAQHARAIVHAREEHRALTTTIQARLSARLRTQVKKLSSEKESNSSSTMSSITSISASNFTDITENNALLLHPSQFGIVAGLSSPRRGGDDADAEKEGGRRKPRRRAGEVEELLAFGVGVNFDLPGSSKRKRGSRNTHAASNAAASFLRDDRDEDVHHPIPETITPTDLLTLDLLQQAGGEEAQKRKREEIMKQVYTPVYHIDKLFTEKELQLAGNQASIATVRYFTERQHHNFDDDEDDTEEHANTGSNTPIVHDTAGEDDHESDELRRERGLSPMAELRLPYAVNTRSNPPRNGGSSRELEGLVHGVPLGMTYVNKAGIAPPPPPLKGDEAERDLAMIRRAIAEGDFGGEEMRRGGSGRGEKRAAGVMGLGITMEGKKVRRG
ncbi:hypothetical protein RUND412_009275 [Rhizina undulata]